MRKENIVVAMLTLLLAQHAYCSNSMDAKDGERIKLGNPQYKIDSKFGPIYGTLTGTAFYLHYCLPGFVPIGDGDCNVDIPGSTPDAVQVHYRYSLGENGLEPMLEGGGWYKFPFPQNINVKGTTPYAESYDRRAKSIGRISDERQMRPVPADKTFDGLVRYATIAAPSFRWWVPGNTTEFQTRLGNPPIFACSSHFCSVTVDLGGGWEARAKFSEAVLSDWRNFYARFIASTNEIMRLK